MRAVDVIDAANLEFGDERELFSRAPYVGADNYTLVNWDISPDGEHFVMVRRSAATPARRHIDLTLDWSEELKERVPASAR